MKAIGSFSANSQQTTLVANGCAYAALWEAEPGNVEIAGIEEFKVRVDDEAGQAMLYMNWMLVDVARVGGKDEVLDVLESHSLEGHEWAGCMKENRDRCPPSVMAGGAIALLTLIVSPTEYQGQGLGTPLARAFADAILAPRGVRAFWIKPVPLAEHPDSGFFKLEFPVKSAAFSEASSRLERHYERSLDAEWTCPDYLRVDLTPAQY